MVAFLTALVFAPTLSAAFVSADTCPVEIDPVCESSSMWDSFKAGLGL